MAEGAPAHGTVAHLLPQTYKRLVSEWLEEDTPSFDYGGFVVGEEISEAKLLGKSEVSKHIFIGYQMNSCRDRVLLLECPSSTKYSASLTARESWLVSTQGQY
jgi:hypothetical protein